MSRTAETMADTVRSRGPDDQGVWVDSAAGIALAHRRLSIVDLTSAGSQPMVSACGRYVLATNGEVYDHPELRRQLQQQEGVTFRGRSDTEAMLEGIARWGLDEALFRLSGMFAFALWDRSERRLDLVRDRLGIKPLYYGWSAGCLLFGSQLKALRAYPGFSAEVDRMALAQYLRHGWVPAPVGLLRNTAKLRPGEVISFRVRADRTGVEECGRRRYWSVEEVVRAGARNPFPKDEEAALDELDRLLRDTVKSHLVADVEVGVLLSGGVDSSLVAALAQAVGGDPVRTYSVGFREADFDESAVAKAVADHLGTRHTQILVGPEETQRVVPDVPSFYDEPLGDSSQIPTILISQLARHDVKVALSGDGGDEGFCGYDRYDLVPRLWRWIAWAPRPVRAAAASVASGVPPWLLHGALGVFRSFTTGYASTRYRNDKLYRLMSAAGARDRRSFYDGLMSLWESPERVVLGAPASAGVEETDADEALGFAEWMVCDDFGHYLPDDLLTKVDRASMGVGLEARVPLLDHRIVEFAWRLPMDFKIRDGQGKWLLRRLLERYVPRTVADRPKQGFGVPVADWLRGPMRSWGEDLLAERRLLREGYFDVASIRRLWEDHLSGRVNGQHALWAILMFEEWLAVQGS